MGNRVDWDTIYYLPESHPKRYETLVLFERGMSFDEIANYRGITAGRARSIIRETREMLGVRNNAHLLSVCKRVGIL